MSSPKSRKIPISRILKKIRLARPTSASETRAAGIPLRCLGVGVFREGFKVKNCDLVLKFPIEEEGETTEGREHSAQEIRRIKRLKKTGVLEQFLPEVFYYDKKSGVIAMRYYPEFENFETQADAMGKMIQKLIYRIARVRCTDIHTENVRMGKPWVSLGRGTPRNAVIIDLGY